MEPAKFDDICILMVEQDIPILDLSNEVLHTVERSPGLAEYPQPPAAAILENRKRLGVLIQQRDQQMGLDNPAALARYQAQINAAKKVSPESKAPGGELWKSRNPGSQVRELIEILETNESINRINLTNLQMGDALAPKLARFFKNEARTCRPDGVFLEVNLTRLKMGEAGIPVVLQSFDNQNIFKEINLSSTNLGWYGAGCLGRVLANNPNIEKLILTSNHFKAIGLEKLLEGLKKNTKLKSLHIRGNHIGDEGAKLLADYLSKHHTLEELNVENNGLFEEGIAVLLEGVRQNGSLQSIRIGQNQGLKEDSDIAFSEALNTVPEQLLEPVFYSYPTLQVEVQAAQESTAIVTELKKTERASHRDTGKAASSNHDNLLNDMRQMFMQGFQAMQKQMDEKFEGLGHRIHELEENNKPSGLMFTNLNEAYNKKQIRAISASTAETFVGALKPS